MSKENIYYDVTPRIFPVGAESTITIQPLYDHRRFDKDTEYQTAFLPAGGYADQTRQRETPRIKTQPVDDRITVNCSFPSEQEYVLVLEKVKDGVTTCLAEFHLYALDSDLFELRPFKGDTHMHTCYSDGIESPAFVAANCRKIGLDFIAITDHRQYKPSLEAIDTFKDIDTDMELYPGEEVHPPDNPVHIVNFGGDFSVNELFKTDSYMAEVKVLESELDCIPQGIDPYTYASCVWCYNKIREGNGLGVFCHPYWFCTHQYDVPEKLTDMLLETQPYDALEIIGGFFKYQVESNTLAVARYHEERSKGKRIPIVGASDSHGTAESDLFGWYYTIVLAESPKRDDIIKGIKNLHSVAVESIPDEATRAYGPFRLVKYTQFLIRDIFPLHDALCAEEGRLMFAWITGDQSAKTHMAEWKGKVAELYNRLWDK